MKVVMFWPMHRCHLHDSLVNWTAYNASTAVMIMLSQWYLHWTGSRMDMHIIHTFFYSVVVWYQSISSKNTALAPGQSIIAPVPMKEPWSRWVNRLYVLDTLGADSIVVLDNSTTTKQSTPKPCAYFIGYTVYPSACALDDLNSLVPGRFECFFRQIFFKLVEISL